MNSLFPPDLVFELLNDTYFMMSKDSDRFLTLLMKKVMSLSSYIIIRGSRLRESSLDLLSES